MKYQCATAIFASALLLASAPALAQAPDETSTQTPAKKDPDGHHAGDMENLKIPKNGKLTRTVVNKKVTLEKDKPNSLFHEGGTAVVIHASADDHTTDPAGNAGDRIACGLIK
jgi:Cu/Zn superoxide dismutase